MVQQSFQTTSRPMQSSISRTGAKLVLNEEVYFVPRGRCYVGGNICRKNGTTATERSPHVFKR